MKDLDSIILEILNELTEGKKVDVEAYCKKYPQHSNAILTKFRTAEFIKNNFQNTDLSGKKLGEYIILQELGRGGMGVVFLGIHSALSRLSAIKVLPPSFTNDKEALENFLEEAKTIAKFSHPNIVPIYSISEEKGVNYISMGYISGIPLKKLIEQLQSNKQSRRLKALAIKEMLQKHSAEECNISQKSIAIKRGLKFWEKSYFKFIATICAEVADALNYAHQNRIIHGDLKPSNILLTNEAIPMVVDFGLSKDINKMDSLRGKEFTGTLAYAAPEQINDNILSEKTDIWSFGVTLYELLSFRNPFREDTIKKTVNKIISDEAPSLKSYDKKIPWELEAIVFKCLEKKPENRYNSFAEIASDLNNYLESKPIKAKPLGIIGRFYRWVRRYPSIFLLTLGFALTIMIASSLFFNKKIIDFLNNGNVSYEQGNYDSALFNYGKALDFIKLVPFSDQRRKVILCSLGDAWLGKGIYEKAIIYYQNSLKIDSKYFPAIWGLGDANLEKGFYAEAIKFYKNGIKLSPNDRYNYYVLGRTLADGGLLDEALENYLIAIKISPNDKDTLKQIISVLNRKGLTQEDEIREYFRSRNLDEKQIDSFFRNYGTLNLIPNAPTR
jgi:serine/threonine protein kinase